MKIYTKTGDKGQTGLFGGERVRKDDARVEAYGSIDELNAVLGVASAASASPRIREACIEIQSELFSLGAEVACAADRRDKLQMPFIQASHIERLENWIDDMESSLSPLENFILPGGTLGAATLHQARTTCRWCSVIDNFLPVVF
jgi:cob(I)alamin adenosyltransferase